MGELLAGYSDDRGTMGELQPQPPAPGVCGGARWPRQVDQSTLYCRSSGGVEPGEVCGGGAWGQGCGVPVWVWRMRTGGVCEGVKVRDVEGVCVGM